VTVRFVVTFSCRSRNTSTFAERQIAARGRSTVELRLHDLVVVVEGGGLRGECAA
jgi:hypothetical protein